MKHFKKFILMVAAMLLAPFLFSIGLITNLIQIYKVGHFFKYLWKFTFELYKLIMDLCLWIALFIDRLGNVIIGNVLIYAFIKKEFKYSTLFKKSEITISCALGHSLENSYFTKNGLKFSKIIDKIFGKNHCHDAYEWQKIKWKYDKENTTGIN